MAQALNPARVAGTATQPSTGPAQVLLASCKAMLYVLRNQQWESLFDSSVFRVQLLRLGPGSFVLLAVDEQTLVVKVKISLRFNTVFKVIKNNFFSLLDNGVTVWAFDITGQPMEAQTFAIVIQNSLASLKELHINKTNRPTLPTATQPTQPTLPRQELKGDQQFYLNNICLTLSDAINRGNQQFASDLARQLASHKAMVRIKLDEPEKDELSKATKDNKLNLKVQVEDKESTGCHFRLNIAPQTTINQLKQMVQNKYEFPAEIQRWIIGKRLPKPSESLLDCGIKTSGSTLFLYLMSDKTAAVAGALPERRVGDERRAPMLNRIQEPNLANVPTLIQQGQRERQYDQVQDVYGIARNMLQSMPNIPSVRIRQPVAAAPEDLVGWVCSQCTFRNSPTRPGCEMCSTDRPADYQVPEDYMPNERERERLEFERSGEMLMREETLDCEDQAVVRH